MHMPPNRHADPRRIALYQSGLLFFAGTQDFYLRAFDTASGKEIWKSRRRSASQSGPMTYVSPKTGKQYIIITVGARVSLRIAATISSPTRCPGPLCARISKSYLAGEATGRYFCPAALGVDGSRP